MSKQIWFLTGSQGLYGEDVLAQVRDQSGQVSGALASASEIPVDVVAKPVLTDPASSAAAQRGTRQTLVRTLETLADDRGVIHPGSGMTKIFIKPGVPFRGTDMLLTNFHLAQSTLLMLVSAFMGRDSALAAYRQAVEQKYRFFSFGDCMLIGHGLVS